MAKEKVAELEKIFESAWDNKYSSWPADHREDFKKFHPIFRWNLVEFIKKYKSSNYHQDRLKELINHLLDIKIELFFLMEVDMGLYNTLVYKKGYDEIKIKKDPYLLLKHLSLDQTTIFKSRILERIMNFIFYLETGENLSEIVRKEKKSKKNKFLEFLKQNKKWIFLEPYITKTLQSYDKDLRNPETHHHSPLIKYLRGQRLPDPRKIFELLNQAINNIWENIILILSGGKATLFTGFHLSAKGKIKKKYWNSNSK